MRDSAIIYRDYYEAVKQLPVEAQAEALMAYMTLTLDGEEYTGGNAFVKAMLMLVKSRIDSANEAYEKKVGQRRKAAKARWNNANECENDSRTTSHMRNDANECEAPSSHSDNDNEYDNDNDTHINESNNKAHAKPVKHKHGEYGHVRLTDQELEKLKAAHSNTDELIKYLDEYIEMKDYKAKSHYLAINKWVVDAVSKRSRDKPETYRDRWNREMEAWANEG